MTTRAPDIDFDAPDETSCCSCPDHVGRPVLPLSAFSPDARKANGVRSWCKACESRAFVRRRKRAMVKMRLTMYGTLPE